MTYAVSERANATRKVQSKSQTKLLCIIRNIINACLRILIIAYLLPIVYRKVFILIITTLFKTKKPQERAIYCASSSTYTLLSLQKQSRLYFNVTLPPKNVYYPNTYHVGKHGSK